MNCSSEEFFYEVPERAARMVFEHVGDHASQWAAIAAIAGAHGASVATRNTDDYDGCEVAVIDPWAPAKVTR